MFKKKVTSDIVMNLFRCHCTVIYFPWFPFPLIISLPCRHHNNFMLSCVRMSLRLYVIWTIGFLPIPPSAKINIKLLSRVIDIVLRNDWLGSGEFLNRLMGRFWGIIGSFLNACTLVVQIFVGLIFFRVGCPRIEISTPRKFLRLRYAILFFDFKLTYMYAYFGAAIT